MRTIVNAELPQIEKIQKQALSLKDFVLGDNH